METSVVGNGVCSSESVDGSRDVWSCKESDSASADHLVVMVNGILGSVADWKFAAEQFVKLLPDKVFVHCSERNVSMLTLDGVDVMGQRLVEEVLEVIQRKPNLKKISFVAHSVGGLVARYAIGKLYRALKTENVEDSSISGSEEDSRGTIGGLEAMNFVIVATPHLGSRGNRQGAKIVDQIVSITPLKNYVPKPEMQEVRMVENAVCVAPENVSSNIEDKYEELVTLKSKLEQQLVEFKTLLSSSMTEAKQHLASSPQPQAS